MARRDCLEMRRKIFLGHVPFTSCFLCSHPFSAVLTHRRSQTFILLYGVFHLSLISPDWTEQILSKRNSEEEGFHMQSSSTYSKLEYLNGSAHVNLNELQRSAARDILPPNTTQTLCEAVVFASKSAAYIAVSVVSAARYEHVAADIYIFHAMSCILLQGFLVAVVPTSQDIYLVLGNAVQLALDLCALHAALLGRLLAALALNGAALAGGGALGALCAPTMSAPALPVRACLLGVAAEGGPDRVVHAGVGLHHAPPPPDRESLLRLDAGCCKGRRGAEEAGAHGQRRRARYGCGVGGPEETQGAAAGECGAVES